MSKEKKFSREEIKFINEFIHKGHSNSVATLIKLEDNLIASGSYDRTIKIWDITKGEALQTLKGHSGYVNTLIKLEDNLIASGSDDRTIKIWDIKKGEALQTLEGHSSYVNTLIKLEDNLIASGSDDRTIKIWDIKKGEALQTLEGHSGSVNTLIKLEDNLIASGSDDRTIKIWDIKKGEAPQTLEGYSDSVTTLIKLEDNLIASGSYDGTIKIWDIKKGEALQTFEGHSDSVRTLIKLENNLIASGSNDKTIKIWDIKKGEALQTLEGHSSYVNTLIKLEDNLIASGSGDRTIKIWDIKKGEALQTLEGHSNIVTTLIKLEDNLIASGSNDRTIKIWDIKKGEALQTLEGHSGYVNTLIKLEDNLIASGSNDRTIKIWDIKKGEALQTLKGHSGYVNTLIKLEDNLIASGSNDRTIKIWDIKKGEALQTLEGHSDSVRTLIKLEDNLIASGSNDRTIKIWDIKKGEALQTLEGHSNIVTTLIKLEDNLIASGSDDWTIKIWDTKKGDFISKIPQQTYVEKLEYFENRLIIGNYLGEIRVVDIEDKTAPKEILSYKSKIQILDIKQDGENIYFCDSSGDFGYFQFNELKAVQREYNGRYYIKTLVLGDSGAGKTTLSHFLKTGEHDDNIHSTHGLKFFEIDLKNIPVENNENREGDFTFLIWDFGGQPEYQISHKQNFSKARMILLVVDLSKERSEDDNIFYWINSINEHKDQTHEDFQIVVIGTKQCSDGKKRLDGIQKEVKKRTKHTCKTILIDTKIDGKEKFEDLLRKYCQKDFIPFHTTAYNDEHIAINDFLLQQRNKELYFENERDLIDRMKRAVEEGNVTFSIEDFENFGLIERLGDYILLKPYWTNLFATTILQKAKESIKVSGAVSKKDLYSYNFDVKFDELLESEKQAVEEEKLVADKDIYNDRFKDAPTEFKDLFLQEILKNFFNDKICYMKNNMFVFPSRFNYKTDSFEKKGYHKIEDIRLVSKRNVEETVGVVITSLFYSEYKIIKHLGKGIKLKDNQNNLFLIEFDRYDFEDEKRNQEETKISVYGKFDNDGKEKIIALIEKILEENLTPKYITKHLKIERDNEEIGDCIITTKQEGEKFDCSGFTIKEVPSKRLLNGKRVISEISKKIEKKRDEVLEELVDFREKEEATREILHLSDLHFCDKTDIGNEIKYLQQDFSNMEKSLNSIDYITLSGDLTSKSKQEEFEKVAEFISKLIELCKIDSEKVLIVPGNHDYSREITHDAFSISNMDSNYKEKRDFKIDDKIYLKRDDIKWRKKFSNFSEYLYEDLYNQSFPEDHNKQIKVISDENFDFYLLNTSYDIDHFSPQNIKYDVKSLVNSVDRESNKIKIAIGHHPLNFDEGYEFVNNLYEFGFKAYIHGHIHRNNLISSKDGQQNSGRELLQIGSGLFFSESPRAMVSGVPYRYNIITFEGEKVSVNTRERQSVNTPWVPSYIYFDKNGANGRTNIWES